MNRTTSIAALLTMLLPIVANAQQGAAGIVRDVMPLAFGESFTIESAALGETRRINVYRAGGYATSDTTPLPVLYMPDGGIGEDFLHIAGLLQVSVGNGTMRPFLLVGIENTERRRDMTAPTTVDADRKIAPRVGGSSAFRRFIKTELMPAVKSRYRTTDELAIVGESLAGLFVIETLLVEPDLFDTYIAFDPSLWWDDQRLVKTIGAHVRAPRRLFVANSNEPSLTPLVAQFVDSLRGSAYSELTWQHISFPDETHGTIYHPAALRAFRLLFTPVER